MTNPLNFLLPLVSFLLSCASAPSPAPQIVIAPGSAVTTDQLQALKDALTAHPHSYWVEVREFPARMVGKSGRASFLWAEALHIQYKVSPHLCHGRLTSFSMRDEGFHTNTWQPHQGELYATYDPAGIDPCAEARERDRRFRFGGVSLNELAGVLEAFTGTVPEDDGAGSPATLLPDERIGEVVKKPTGPNASVIEVHTTQQDGDHGRVLEFERCEGLWIGRVRGPWVA